MTTEDEITALRAENARLREQLSESHCAARVTEMQRRCTRAEAAERFARAVCDRLTPEFLDGMAEYNAGVREPDGPIAWEMSSAQLKLAADYVRARDAVGGT